MKRNWRLRVLSPMDRQFFTYQSKVTGMTLLEIILSLAILGGTVVVIGEVARSSFQNARMARDTVQAELLAESILAKVRLGIIELEPVFDMPVGLQTTNSLDIVQDSHAVSEGNLGDVLWLYSLEVVDIDIVYDADGNEIGSLVEVAVTVRRNLPEERRPVVCRLVRWFAIEPEVEEEAEST